MIADILTVGCADQDIQEELLLRSATTKTLEEKFELMQAMESGKSARTDIYGHSSVQAQRSTNLMKTTAQDVRVAAVSLMVQGHIYYARVTVQHEPIPVNTAISLVTSPLFVGGKTNINWRKFPRSLRNQRKNPPPMH